MDKQLSDTILHMAVRIIRIENKLDTLILKETHEMAILDNLTAAVAEETAVDASAIKKLDDLIAQIAALAAQPTVDPAALQGLVDQIKANDASLSAKVGP